MTTTTFYGLFQGDHSDIESDATILAVFSTEKRAKEFEEVLSAAHTELKREANDLYQESRRDFTVNVLPEVPDLYWDIRPIPFDPRDEEEL